jgi:prepilin signal peptidase PulO-like enzyme (type II secretory pathway)
MLLFFFHWDLATLFVNLCSLQLHLWLGYLFSVMFQSGHCNFVLYLAISSIAKTVIYLASINELLAYNLDANCCNESNEMKLDGMMASMGLGESAERVEGC